MQKNKPVVLQLERGHEVWFPWNDQDGFRVENAPRLISAQHRLPFFMFEFIEGTLEGCEVLAPIRESIPPEILSLVAQFPDTHYDLLRLASLDPEAFLQLGHSAPALVYLLAREVSKRVEHEVKDLMRRKRKEILRFCEWPENAWRLMAQTTPETFTWISADVFCSSIRRYPKIIRLLRHQGTPLTPRVVRMAAFVGGWKLVECPDLAKPDAPSEETVLEILRLRRALGHESFPWRRLPSPKRVAEYRVELVRKWRKRQSGPLPLVPFTPPRGWRQLTTAEEVVLVADQFRNCLLSYLTVMQAGQYFAFVEDPPRYPDWPLVALVEGLNANFRLFEVGTIGNVKLPRECGMAARNEFGRAIGEYHGEQPDEEEYQDWENYDEEGQ